MAQYYTTIVTTSIPVKIQWECSKCGKMAEARDVISAKGFNRHGGWNTKSKQDKSSRIASGNAKALLALKLSGIENNPIGANLSCNCPSCHYKEPWAKSTENIQEMLFKIGLYLDVFSLPFLMVCLMDLRYLALCIAIDVLPWIIRHVLASNDAKNAEKCRNLPESSKPHIIEILS